MIPEYRSNIFLIIFLAAQIVKNKTEQIAPQWHIRKRTHFCGTLEQAFFCKNTHKRNRFGGPKAQFIFNNLRISVWWNRNGRHIDPVVAIIAGWSCWHCWMATAAAIHFNIHHIIIVIFYFYFLYFFFFAIRHLNFVYKLSGESAEQSAFGNRFNLMHLNFRHALSIFH